MAFSIPSIPPLDISAMQAARKRQSSLTKPEGSLGQLEELSIQLAGITGQHFPDLQRKAVVVMAADHGVSAEGVSAYPAEVTRQMVANFLAGGAAINVLARLAGAQVVVVDMGVAADLDEAPGLIRRKIARGTSNMSAGAAMTREQAEEALQTGVEVADGLIDSGVNLLASGDMGIGNTTPSSAITAVITDRPAAQVTGRGTGLGDEALARKVELIAKSITLNRPDPADALDVVSKVGGFEIAGLAGVMLGAAARRVPVVVDGFISGAAALIAAGLSPAVKPYLIAAHQSVEIGHKYLLEHLGLKPLLNLDLRLGEGTGAALAFPILEAACRILQEMATFDEAQVSHK